MTNGTSGSRLFFFRPDGAPAFFHTTYPRLAPWAEFLRRFAAGSAKAPEAASPLVGDLGDSSVIGLGSFWDQSRLSRLQGSNRLIYVERPHFSQRTRNGAPRLYLSHR